MRTGLSMVKEDLMSFVFSFKNFELSPKFCD